MSLLDRVTAATTCAVVDCAETRVEGSLVCQRHLTEMWANRLDKLPDGTFVARRRFVARDESGALRFAR